MPRRAADVCLAIPGKVVEKFREHDALMGRVDFDGVVKKVCLEHVPDIAVGDYALVHVGFALSRVDPEEAKRIFGYLKEMKALEELEP
jgi:hydrogenase expression/formation protein HypC